MSPGDDLAERLAEASQPFLLPVYVRALYVAWLIEETDVGSLAWYVKGDKS
jgi:hypothetical protein